jgi:AraC family ethanolamine operon transcriptional activator
MRNAIATPCFAPGLRIDVSSSDPAAQDRASLFWGVSHLQLEPGPYRWHIRAVHGERLQLAAVRRSLTTRIIGMVPADCVAVGVALGESSEVHFRGRKLAADELALARSGEDVSFQPAGDSCVLSVAIHHSLMQEFASTRGAAGFEFLYPGDLLRTGRAAGAGTKAGQLLECLERWLADAPTAMDAGVFEAEVMELLFAGLEDGGRALPSTPRGRAALQAEALALAKSRQPLSLKQLCEMTGVAARTLELGFREAFGIPMKRYVQALRFNGARRGLLAAPAAAASVKSVALQWGFRHMGRFAREYRDWFGESPSETLAREGVGDGESKQIDPARRKGRRQ